MIAFSVSRCLLGELCFLGLGSNTQIPYAEIPDRTNDPYLFGAPPEAVSPGNPARDTNRRKRRKSQRFRRLVLQMQLEDDAPVPLIETAVLITLDTFLAILCVVLALH